MEKPRSIHTAVLDWDYGRPTIMKQAVDGDDLVTRLLFCVHPWQRLRAVDGRFLCRVDELLLQVVAERPAHTAEVAARMAMNQKTCHRRLARLVHAGLLHVRRERGRFWWTHANGFRGVTP